MPERLTPERRSALMSRVRTHDTGPELVVRRLLHSMGYRYRLHRKDLPGKPDIVLQRYRTVIFVHGCFWHGHEGCPRATRPATNIEFWTRKLDANLARDARDCTDLERLGWNVVVIWECETHDIGELKCRLQGILTSEAHTIPIRT